MTLLDYITEAVSHGRRYPNRYIGYIDSINELYTLEDLTNLLDLIGYSEIVSKRVEIKDNESPYNKNSYIITYYIFPDSNVQVEIMNIKKPDCFIRVHFGKHTKRIVRVEIGEISGSTSGSRVWRISISNISKLIEYLK